MCKEEKDAVQAITEIAAEDVKVIVKAIQSFVNELVKTNSRFIAEKFDKITADMYNMLPFVIAVTEGNIDGTKKIMLGGKVECLALSYDDTCDYYVVVPTMSGVTLNYKQALIKKENIDKMPVVK